VRLQARAMGQNQSAPVIRNARTREQ